MTEQTEGAEVEALADQLMRWEQGQDGANETDHWADRLARALLASDWLAAREAAAEVRGAQAVLAADAEIAGPLAEWLCNLLGEPRALVSGEVLAGLTAARAAAAVTTSSAKSSDLATRVPQDESQRAAGGGGEG